MAFLLATSCDLHPDEIFTGFCPSCLRERLAGLDAASSLSSAPRRSTSALKSLFSILPSSSTTTAGAGPEASSSSAALPHPITSSELRRCKSFSARPASSAAFVRSNSQVVREERTDPNAEVRPMKMHIDLESSQSNNRDQKASSSSSSSAANFWIKKWNSWRNKQKHKKHHDSPTTSKAAKAAMPPPPKIPNPSGRQSRPRRYCDTQSELGGGRRSCDTDPRFSVDAGRISLDCPPRFSLDEPSWDRPGYSRMHPTLSTVQDAPDPLIYRCDGQIPVEGSLMPGSQAQTRDYYLDSSSRRRRSFERSISGRKSSQIDLSNSKVSPAGSSEFYQHNQHAIRDELSESFNSTAYRERESEKKGKKWSLWGLINKKRNNDRDQIANVVDRSFSEAWPELRGQLGRSNSTVSGRSSFSGSMRRNSVESSSINGYSKSKRRDEFVLERSRNGRLINSPGRVDYNNINNGSNNNGMLRFYLGPTGGNQSGRRSNGIRPVNYTSNSQSFSSKRMY